MHKLDAAAIEFVRNPNPNCVLSEKTLIGSGDRALVKVGPGYLVEWLGGSRAATKHASSDFDRSLAMFEAASNLRGAKNGKGVVLLPREGVIDKNQTLSCLTGNFYVVQRCDEEEIQE